MKINIHTHNPKPDEITISSIGIHPYNADDATTDSMLAIEREAEGVDAIGEIGLDYCCSADKSAQALAFRVQLEIAQKAGKGVVIHCVKAFEDVMNILKDYSLKFVIFHGFIGSAVQSARATKQGYYLSFGERTFRSPKSIEAMRATPIERLFLETDEAQIEIGEIYSRASAILGVPEAVLEYITTENYNRICG